MPALQPIVNIDKCVLAKIEVVARRQLPLETGGALLGCWLRPEEVSVFEMTCAGPRGVATRSSFVPDVQYIDDELRARWGESHGLIAYLGDWHTHPNLLRPRLSFRDRRTVKATSRSMPDQRLIHMLVGVGLETFSPTVWFCRRGHILCSRLEVH